MRLGEAILADLPRLTREAEDLGKINIQDGTKGGRSGASAPRWITVDERIRDALEFAEQVSPTGSHNLIAPNENYLGSPTGIRPLGAGHPTFTKPQRLS